MKDQKIHALILAAGLSSRMGDFKPLLPVRGKTLIENTIDSALDGGAEEVVVVTGYRAGEIEELLKVYGDRVKTVRNEEFASTDMLRSIQIGAACLGICDAFFLLPGDMPAIQSETFRALKSMRRECKRKVIFPTLEGHRKHPPLIDASLISKIIDFKSDGGLRELWRMYEGQIAELPVDDIGVWIDVDYPGDYQKLKNLFHQEKEGKVLWRKSVRA